MSTAPLRQPVPKPDRIDPITTSVIQGALENIAIEIVNLRLVGAASAAKIAKPSAGTAKSLAAAKVREGTGTFRIGTKLSDYPTTFYRRDLLPVGERIPGPAIVLQMDSTTVVPPQHSFQADAAGNLIIRKTNA